MQLQHADPHDAIAAQLRALSTSHAKDPSGPDVTPATSPEPANEPPLGATPLNDNTGDMRILTSRARSGRRVVFLAICAGVAATMAWHVYGDQAKQRLSSLLPQFVVNAPAPTQSANAAEPQDVTSQTAPPQPTADAPTPAPAQESSNTASDAPTPAAPTPATPAASEPAPTQAALPPEVTQSLDTMAQEIASLKQTVEQLRAGQQQLSSDVAKLSEQAARHKVTEQTPKPASRQRPRHSSTPAAASRTPVASRTVAPAPPPQPQSQRQDYRQVPAQREAYIPPPAPARLPPPPGDSSVPRPPMPLQ